MEPKILAGLYKRLYKSFDIRSFEDRLKIQKFVYIVQSRKINLGYLFNFYLYGPYSTDLTRNAYSITDFEHTETLRFANDNIESTFKDILSTLEPHKDDMKWLEGAASILLLVRMGYNKESVYNKMQKKVTKFGKSELGEIWDNLKQIGWINAE